ncbi:hypothetical protein KJA16_01325 [Patescibacteria group bacterium]|nr:hypothetical protein [Patescibacteria group bacterium]
MAGYKKISIVFLLMIFLSSVLVDFSFAAERELEVPIPGLETTTLPVLPDYIGAIYNFALMIIGLVCFGALIYGGIRYLTSAGKPAAMSDAKDQIFSALLGLIILFSSYLILTTINPELVILSESPKETVNCTEDADCPSQACVGGRCSQSGDDACIQDADCPPLVCTEGFCSALSGGGWTSCSSYFISNDCTNANCKWCPVCSGTSINQWKVDKCVDAVTDCGYVCVVGECGAETCD